jgi:thiol-disulfide isomerase/thioredoxin
MNSENLLPQEAVLVVCLCAEWCGVCRDYVQTFQQMQTRFPLARFLWIDVEDDADLLHPLEVENFPTLLLIAGGQPRFFGPVRPQPQTLERLIRAQIENGHTQALTDRTVVELAARIQAAKPAAGR